MKMYINDLILKKSEGVLIEMNFEIVSRRNKIWRSYHCNYMVNLNETLIYEIIWTSLNKFSE